MMFQSLNPATGALIAEWKLHTSSDIERIIDHSQTAYQGWSKQPYARKADFLLKLGRALREKADKLALLATREMGKPIKQALAEVEKSATLCEYYAQHGEAYLTTEPVNMPNGSGKVVYQPLGTVFCIMPWNFPYWQVLRCVVPSILLGNTVILKHAPNVIGCASALQDVFEGIEGASRLFQHVIADNDQAADIIKDDRIIGVALTGSERAGSAVAAVAGSALKKCVLELGGSDPLIVAADADVEAALDAVISSRFGNAGQVCIAAKRILVDSAIELEFTERLVAKTESLVVGDPEQDTTDMGPMARDDLRSELHSQVEQSIELGAKLVFGGQAVEANGFYYEPTILTHLVSEAPALCQETFGPVAAIVPFNNVDEAVTVSNKTQYGLSASVWTKDRELASRIALNLDCGNVFINSTSFSDPRLPFGGIKRSGFGRELAGFGLHEFANVKSIYNQSPG